MRLYNRILPVFEGIAIMGSLLSFGVALLNGIFGL